MNMPLDTILKAIQPQYAIPERSLHWYVTYTYHRVEQMGMYSVTVDHCDLVRHQPCSLVVILSRQVDDSMAVGTSQFMRQDETASKRYKGNDQKIPSNDDNTLNGSILPRAIYCTITMT